MIKLETEFESGAGGFVGADIRLYKQIKRADRAAIYSRIVKSTGKLDGFEVFRIGIIPKGRVNKFPNGTTSIVPEDTEQYPASSKFGLDAYFVSNMDRAEIRFGEILEKNAADEESNPSVKEETIFPAQEFSTRELAEKNSWDYGQAFLFIKDALANGSVKFIREERRNVKGKMTRLFSKV